MLVQKYAKRFRRRRPSKRMCMAFVLYGYALLYILCIVKFRRYAMHNMFFIFATTRLKIDRPSWRAAHAVYVAAIIEKTGQISRSN